MDARVPRNNSERRVIHHPYHRHAHRTPTQLEIIREHAINMLRAQTEQEQNARLGRLENTVDNDTKKAKRKTRRKYTMKFLSPDEEDEKSELTTRDLARLMPVDQGGVIVIYNTQSLVVRLEQQASDKNFEIETVAKARLRNPGHKMIVVKETDTEEDVDRMVQEVKESLLMKVFDTSSWTFKT